VKEDYDVVYLDRIHLQQQAKNDLPYVKYGPASKGISKRCKLYCLDQSEIYDIRIIPVKKHEY
jgi:hypothetical protein